MMKPKQQRFWLITVSVTCLLAGVVVAMQAMRSHMVYFITPSDIRTLEDARSKDLRMGGLVEVGSFRYLEDGTLLFRITDGGAAIEARFRGVVPALFREGQGVIAEGRIQPDGSFTARSILAKHDERYMPPEVVEKLKANGHWHEPAP